MIVVTGGAGFIGSCMVRTLNDKGLYDILIVDDIGKTEKWINIRNKKFISYMHKGEFKKKLYEFDNIEMIFHFGACSSTTEINFDYLWNNNFEYTKTLWNYCVKHGARFIYASSAATYGAGEQGFDDQADITTLKPLNAYGYSKQVFDLWVEKQAIAYPRQYVGVKFFNVYGPNEYHKGSMASMVYHGFNQINMDGEVRLFKSINCQYKDGGQLRDFVYVKDVCDVMYWLYCHEDVSGLFNIGTGKAQSFKELAEAIFDALDILPNIRYIDMPKNLKNKYQYYTQAKIENLRDVGYEGKFKDVKSGVADYVKLHLSRDYEVY